MAARKLMAERVARAAAEDTQGETTMYTQRLRGRCICAESRQERSLIIKPHSTGNAWTRHQQLIGTLSQSPKNAAVGPNYFISQICFSKNLVFLSLQFLSEASTSANDQMPRPLTRRDTGIAVPDQPEGALDMTPPFMYYSVAWVWLEYLSRGLEAAEETMSTCLDLVQPKMTPDGGASGYPADRSSSNGLHGMLAGEPLVFKPKSQTCGNMYLVVSHLV